MFQVDADLRDRNASEVKRAVFYGPVAVERRDGG